MMSEEGATDFSPLARAPPRIDGVAGEEVKAVMPGEAIRLGRLLGGRHDAVTLISADVVLGPCDEVARLIVGQRVE